MADLQRPDWWTSDEWRTPDEIINILSAEFGDFTLDPCARVDTAKASVFYTKSENGLIQPWTGRVWLNPPYSNIGPWLEKARKATADNVCELVCALIPAATDTSWFHEHVVGHAEIRYIRGRVRFIGWQGTPIPAPRTPSLICIYRGGARG